MSSSAQFDHCCRVYEAMAREAKEEVEETLGPDEEIIKGETMLVYTGHLTKVFNQLELSTPYYTSVMRALKNMGCVEQLQRGGGTSPSRWVLHMAPELDVYETRSSPGSAPKGPKARIDALERTMNRILQQHEVILNHLGVKL